MNVTLSGKKGLCNVINLRIETSRLPWTIWWALKAITCTHREPDLTQTDEKAAGRPWKQRLEWHSNKPNKASDHWQRLDSPMSSRVSTANSVISAQWNQFQLLTYREKNSCCFKPLFVVVCHSSLREPIQHLLMFPAWINTMMVTKWYFLILSFLLHLLDGTVL